MCGYHHFGTINYQEVKSCRQEFQYSIINKINQESIGVIISNENRIGFNTVGSLLFGLVRIYEKRLKYLQFDCNNIQNKLNPTKQNLDLPKQNNEYAINSGFGNIHEILDIDVENLNIDDIDWINDTNNVKQLLKQTNSSILLDSIEIERSRISDINVTTNEGEKRKL